MRTEDTKAIRLYGPYNDGGQHWIAHTPQGDIQNFKDPIDLAIWLEERAERPLGSVVRQANAGSMLQEMQPPGGQEPNCGRTTDGPDNNDGFLAQDTAGARRGALS